MEKTIHGKW